MVRARRWKALAAVAVVAATAALGSIAPFPAQAWVPDTTYGSGGQLAAPNTTFVTDRSGRLLVLQPSYQPTLTAKVVRYDTAGRLDPTYGSGGTATVTWPQLTAPPVLVLAADGSVLLWSTPAAGAPGALVGAEIDPTGQLDGTFGTAGIATPSCCASSASLPLTEVDDAVLADDGTSRLLVTRYDRTSTTLVAREISLVSIDAGGAVTGQSPVSNLTAGSHRLVPAGGGSVLLASEEVASNATISTRVTRRLEDLTPDGSYGNGGSRRFEGALTRVASAGGRAWIATWQRNGFFDIYALGADGLAVPGFGTAGVTRWGRLPVNHDDGVINIVGMVPTPGGGLVVAGTRRACVKLSFGCETYAYGAKVQQIAPDGSFGPVAPIDELSSSPFGLALGPGRTSVLVGRNGPVSEGSIRRYELVDDRIAQLAPFPSSAALADRLAQDFLDRPATAQEADAIAGQIDLGTSVSYLVRVAADQEGWTRRHDPVVRLYRAYFGRIPDHAGLRYWMGRRAAGVTVARISSSFAASSEFQRTYGSLSNRDFVALVYRNVLGREADPVGLDYWSGRITARTASRGQVMASMSESAENVRKRADEVTVIGLHVALLQRVPTPAELDAWTGPSPLGDEDALVRYLISGPEYLARLH